MWNWGNGWPLRVSNKAFSRLELCRKTNGNTVVEQYRLLHGMLQVIQEVNGVTGLPLCNETTCPTMSAGR